MIYPVRDMRVQKRELKVIIETIPIFTGEDDDGSHPWSDIEAALDNIPERFFNQSDAIAKFLTRLDGLERKSSMIRISV